MSKTQLGGTRIRQKTLNKDHFQDNLDLPEGYLKLNYPTHPHINKQIIDKIRYTGARDTVDLKDLEQVLLEVIGARIGGHNLAGTLQLKADADTVQDILAEIVMARGTASNLDEAIRQYGTYLENKLNEHKGVVEHLDLDTMFYDYISAKNGAASLSERLDSLGTGTGSGSGVTVNVLNPWRFTYTIANAGVTDDENKTVVIPYSYTINSNSIEVFEGPLLMESGVGKDYIEVNSNTIKFADVLPTGTKITIMGLDGLSLYLWKQCFQSTPNQQDFSFLGEYRVGYDDLVIYESGLLMSKGIDYEETSVNSIRFLTPLPGNVLVTALRRR